MTYGVLVQVSVHGTDNSPLLEMLAAHPGRLRGVAVVSPGTSDATLSALHEAGVAGLRMNSVSGGGIGFELCRLGAADEHTQRDPYNQRSSAIRVSASALTKPWTVARLRIPIRWCRARFGEKNREPVVCLVIG